MLLVAGLGVNLSTLATLGADATTIGEWRAAARAVVLEQVAG